MTLENGLKSLNDKKHKENQKGKQDGWMVKTQKVEKDCKHRNLLQHKGQEN